MKPLFVAIIKAGSCTLLIALILIATVLRFDLITVEIKPAFWYLLGGFTFAPLGAWLRANTARYTGTLLFTAGTVLLLLGASRAVWPKSAAALGSVQQRIDAKVATAVNAATAPAPASSPTPTPAPTGSPAPLEIPIPPEFLN